MADTNEPREETRTLACLACGAKTVIVAGPTALCDRISELEAIMDDLDPGCPVSRPVESRVGR